MIWVLVAAVGVPLWILAGCLVGARWSRRRFKREPGAFAAKLRIASGEVDGLKQSWPHRAFVACWTHDVLVIHRGLALVRTDLLGSMMWSCRASALPRSHPVGKGGITPIADAATAAR